MWDFLYLCMKIGRLMDEDKDFMLEELTRGVCEIAKQAGAYIREERRKFSLESVERKHAHDYVSYVDKGSEKQIVSALRQLLPEAGRRKM